VLARHDRLEILPLILSESRLRHEMLTGRKRVRVTSAQSLSDDRLATIRQQLDDALSFEPIVEPAVDESLLGGLIIQIEDTVYDSSLRTRLKQLRGRMRERSLHEIQSGRNRFSSPEGD
jgi:F-type H+-transporting ATPase subunit delta